MSASNRKVIANRKNGGKSHGPINTSSTRFNATKHSLTASGITELDNLEGYDTTLKDLTAEKKPVGVVERFLVQSLALDMVRWQRARRLEAEFITAVLHPAQHEKDATNDLVLAFVGPVIDPGLPAPISVASVQCLVGTFQRYESFFANRWSRTLHELERVQRMRQGECLPAPIAVDLSGHEETGTLDSGSARPEVMPTPSPATANVTPSDAAVADSGSAGPETAKVLTIDGESIPGPAAANVIPSDTGVMASATAEPKEQSARAANGENSAALDAVDVDEGVCGMVDVVPAALDQPKSLSEEVDVDAGTLDSAPEVFERPKNIPGDER